MELALDFRSSATDPIRSALALAERLLNCHQFALGHELPNRLVGIQGLARLLLLEAGLPGEVRGLLENLASLTQRADELVRAVSALGRLQREGTTGGPTAPGEAVIEAATQVNVLSSGRPIEYHLEADLPSLPVSRDGLHQVLLHLLRNAVQAADAVRPLRVQISARRVPEGVELTVTDNGRGLEEGRAERLFEPFASSDGGLGLGLFLVRQVVASWGGALRVCSVPGQGTTVTLLIRV
jgi:signal transduction histidine kinase